MGRPREKSRKGLMLRCSMIWHEADRWWRPYRGDWQPDAKLREATKRHIASMRQALDELEAAL